MIEPCRRQRPVSPGARIDLELDGADHLDRRAKARRDRHRDRLLHEPGWVVPRDQDDEDDVEHPVVLQVPISLGFYTSSMALSIKSERADRLARELVALTGESITGAVESALEERLEAERRRRRRRSLDDVIERFQRLPVVDDRSAEEILGYGDDGLPQ